MFEEANRLIDKKEAPGNLDRAVEILEALKAQHPANDVVRGKLAHAHFYKGRFAPEGSRQREEYFERGMRYGQEAVTLYPRARYGNFWYASNLGMLGLCRGIMSSLKSIDPMRKAMGIVLEENEKFFFAGPHRALGRLFHQAPGWPISIGKKTTALDHLERAVELAPRFPMNRLFLAELYLDLGKKNKAREHLEWLRATPLDPDHAKEDGEYQNEAGRLLHRAF